MSGCLLIRLEQYHQPLRHTREATVGREGWERLEKCKQGLEVVLATACVPYEYNNTCRAGLCETLTPPLGGTQQHHRLDCTELHIHHRVVYCKQSDNTMHIMHRHHAPARSSSTKTVLQNTTIQHTITITQRKKGNQLCSQSV